MEFVSYILCSADPTTNSETTSPKFYKFGIGKWKSCDEQRIYSHYRQFLSILKVNKFQNENMKSRRLAQNMNKKFFVHNVQ